MTYEVGPRKYALDEGWGKLPDGYEYERVAGVAVDGSDRVYVFNRSSHPLMVLSREGELLDAWDRDFIEPHGAHVDQEGNVYLVDRDTYVVEKFSPGGELLLTRACHLLGSCCGSGSSARDQAPPVSVPKGTEAS